MPRFDLDDLLQKDKAELDRIKTAMDIYQSDDKFEFERKKFRTENIRFVGIALLTAIISLGSAYLIESFKQKNASQTAVQNQFSDLRKSYLTEKDKNKQKEIACALSSLDNTFNDAAIANAQTDFKEICQSVSTIQQQAENISNTDTSSAEVKQAIAKLDTYDKELQELNQQKKAASSSVEQSRINNEIAEVKGHIDSVVAAVPEIKPAVKSTEDIEQKVKQVQKINTGIEASQQSPGADNVKTPVSWFKEGYFLQCNEYRILLQYLDKNLGIQVEVCKTSGSEICARPLLTKAWVKYNAPLQFSDNGKSYRINLEAIEHAGKNPFTLAAYITFETLSAKQ